MKTSNRNNVIFLAALSLVAVACAVGLLSPDVAAGVSMAGFAGVVFSESNRVGDVLVEEQSKNITRDTGVLISGQNLAAGAVLGRITASGKLTICDSAAVDGSQNAVGVLLFAVDATAADKACVFAARDCAVKSAGLVYKAGTTAPQSATMRAALLALSIKTLTSV